VLTLQDLKQNARKQEYLSTQGTTSMKNYNQIMGKFVGEKEEAH
jgi:hypothetical protein